MTDWQPIETAPKDENILLFDGDIHEGYWDEVDYDEFRDVRIMGWVYGSANIDPTNFSPTHWRPVPPPPRVTESEDTIAHAEALLSFTRSDK